MKLRSILVGTAVVLTPMSAAYAAGDVVAEPEPMEYVKVCDVYGKGFFYIPGTETCLKFNGYVRTEFIYTDTARTETTDWRYRARLNIDARNETDWGTLRSYIRFQGNGRGGGDGNLEITRAVISLGGLSMGYATTFFTENHDDGWQQSAFDAYYNDDDAVFLQYSFGKEENGFSATVGVQDTISVAAVPTGTDSLDPYAGISYGFDMGSVAGTIIYDSMANEFAWKVSAEIEPVEKLNIKGWYAGDNGGTKYVTGDLAPAVSWEWGVDAVYSINNRVLVWAGYTDADFVDAERFGFGLVWKPVKGLAVRPEAIFGPNYTQARLRVVRKF